MKIVINNRYGGFSLSKEATEWMAEKGHPEAAKELTEVPWYGFRPENRVDPILIEAVETLGEAANGRFAKLKVVEVPDEVDWEIQEYDGVEWVAEKHRIWR